MKCPYCKSDPFDYVDVGIGMVAVAVTCCQWGVALIQYGKTPHQIHKMQRQEKIAERQWRKYQYEHQEQDT